MQKLHDETNKDGREGRLKKEPRSREKSIRESSRSPEKQDGVDLGAVDLIRHKLFGAAYTLGGCDFTRLFNSIDKVNWDYKVLASR